MNGIFHIRNLKKEEDISELYVEILIIFNMDSLKIKTAKI